MKWEYIIRIIIIQKIILFLFFLSVYSLYMIDSMNMLMIFTELKKKKLKIVYTEFQEKYEKRIKI